MHRSWLPSREAAFVPNPIVVSCGAPSSVPKGRDCCGEREHCGRVGRRDPRHQPPTCDLTRASSGVITDGQRPSSRWRRQSERVEVGRVLILIVRRARRGTILKAGYPLCRSDQCGGGPDVVAAGREEVVLTREVGRIAARIRLVCADAIEQVDGSHGPACIWCESENRSEIAAP